MSKPAEVWPMAFYLEEEMIERGWTTTDVAIRVGGSAEQIVRNVLVLDLIMSVQDDRMKISDQHFLDLAKAFDVSADFFRSLDAAWRSFPDRRVSFEPSIRVFSPSSNRSAFEVITGEAR